MDSCAAWTGRQTCGQSREALTRGSCPGRRARAEPLARPTLAPAAFPSGRAELEQARRRRMQRHRLLAGIAAVALMIPAATAYGADQDVQVHVLPSDTLSLSVDGWADFGGLEVGQKGHFDYWMNITNTTTDGWQVA